MKKIVRSLDIKIFNDCTCLRRLGRRDVCTEARVCRSLIVGKCYSDYSQHHVLISFVGVFTKSAAVCRVHRKAEFKAIDVAQIVNRFVFQKVCSDGERLCC